MCEALFGDRLPLGMELFHADRVTSQLHILKRAISEAIFGVMFDRINNILPKLPRPHGQWILGHGIGQVQQHGPSPRRDGKRSRSQTSASCDWSGVSSRSIRGQIAVALVVRDAAKDAGFKSRGEVQAELKRLLG